MQSERRKKRSEHARLTTLSQHDRRAIRQVTDERVRARREQPPDFVSALLRRWRLCELVRYSKLLLILLHRNRYAPPSQRLRGTQRLLYYQHHSEAYDCVFAEYALLRHGDEWLCFRAFYSAHYHAAKEFGARALQDPAQRQTHADALRACFVCALVHDARVRRFVFARHDIHTHYLHTVPPCPRKAARFLVACREPVNRLCHGALTLDELCACALQRWEEYYEKTQ